MPPSGEQQYRTEVITLVLPAISLECVLCIDTHPVGLSDSLLSAHLNVTLLAAGAAVTGDPWAPGPLWAPVCPTLIKRLSSSSSSARKEHEEGGDWTAVALQMETNDTEEERACMTHQFMVALLLLLLLGGSNDLLC